MWYCYSHSLSARHLPAVVCLQLLLGIPAFILGQNDHQNQNNSVIIGEMAGKTAFQELSVPTRFGNFSLSEAGAGRPFRVEDAGPSKVVLQYIKTSGFSAQNPTRIVYKFYESERSLITALILDEVDYAILENEASALEVSKSNAAMYAYPLKNTSNRVKMVCYNNRREILADRRVRQALSYAIDHNKILKLIDNKATIAKGPFDDTSPLYNSGMEDYRFSPRTALRLLQSAGWRDSDRDDILEKNGIPFVITLNFPRGIRLDEAIARQIQINLLSIGVDVKPRPLSRIEMNEKLTSRDFEAVLMDYEFEDSVESLAAFFSNDGSYNYMGYDSPTFEKYLGFYNQVEQMKQQTLIKSMQNVINTDQPVTFLFYKWTTHHVYNYKKFDNVKDSKGRIRPFDEWILLQAQ